MKIKYILLLVLFFSTHFVFCQTTNDLMNQVSQQGIIQTVRDLSGEDSTFVGGNKVLIEHRVSSIGNNLAADYIVEQLTTYGLNVSTIDYTDQGRNIVATQTGLVHPDSIYIISAHYDAVTNYAADDNASGVAAVLETARILSKYKFDNTIKYALWDEEEQGEVGAKNYASTARSNNDKILAVLNMDMIGHDSDNDKLFDIDVQDIANSYQIKNDLIDIVNSYHLNLVSNVVDPGTWDSDHAAFWEQGYSALLLGEAWSTGDITPGYHTTSDRISLFNFDYFYNMVKLCVGYTTTKGVVRISTGLNPISQLSCKLYPNPTNGIVNMELDKSFIGGELTVMNVYGEHIIKQKIQEQLITLNMETLPSGIYIYRFTDNRKKGSQLIKVLKK